jgi:hypothetical protein
MQTLSGRTEQATRKRACKANHIDLVLIQLFFPAAFIFRPSFRVVRPVHPWDRWILACPRSRAAAHDRLAHSSCAFHQNALASYVKACIR